jgi:Ca2+-binding RTX toxin-like protein
MPTTFNWIYLGQSTDILDPTEGNADAENASLFVNRSFGSTTNPLYSHVTRATTIDNGGAAGVLDMNNTLSNDQFTTDIGSGAQTFTFDGLSTFNATLTYTDGTTASFLAVLVQDTAGHLFLAPPPDTSGTNPANIAALTAKPIQSVTFNSVNTSTNVSFIADRTDIGFDNGIVQGTAGNDLIDANYIEPVTVGSDRVDNNDALDGSNADRIEAGAGNDTVLAGLGNDTVFGGTGNDSILGDAGNDSLLGADGTDTLRGDTGNDFLDGGAGADSLTGGTGNDSLQGGEGNDTLLGDGFNGRWAYESYTRNFTSDPGQAFTIEQGTQQATGVTNTLDVTAIGQAATGSTFFPNDFGVIYTSTLYSPTGGTYSFATTSDDGSTIRILDSQGNPLTFNNQGNTSKTFLDNDLPGNTTRSGEVVLQANQTYTIEIRFWDNTGAQSLTGTITPPGGVATSLDASPLILGVEVDPGNDVLDGGAGADLLYGGGGNDTLTAGENDTLSGGDGDDLFVLGTQTETGNGTITIVGGEGSETAGDTLQLNGNIGRGNITFTNTNDTAGGLSGSFILPDGTPEGTLVTFSEIENIICFTPGARILTPRGERPVESLRPGDMVITRDHGPQPLRWIGRRTVPGLGRFAPVRVGPAIFGSGAGELLVSPQHRLLITGYHAELLFGSDEVLVAAKHLVGGTDTCVAPCEAVTYIHLMFDRHEVIYAEGLATESFFAGDAALTAVDDAARDELFAIFPELRSSTSHHHHQTARRCLRAHEAAVLRERLVARAA